MLRDHNFDSLNFDPHSFVLPLIHSIIYFVIPYIFKFLHFYLCVYFSDRAGLPYMPVVP